MPVATKIFGYFPGKALRLGEDLPPGIARDWAGRRQPEFSRIGESRTFDDLLGRYADIRASTLALSATDDAFAPSAAARRLLGLYPNIKVQHESITPASVGRRRLGHFGFLRRPTGEIFWERAATWLLSEQGAGLAE
jgi:predicted alpha/beta hydrolase